MTPHLSWDHLSCSWWVAPSSSSRSLSLKPGVPAMGRPLLTGPLGHPCITVGARGSPCPSASSSLDTFPAPEQSPASVHPEPGDPGPGHKEGATGILTHKDPGAPGSPWQSQGASDEEAREEGHRDHCRQLSLQRAQRLRRMRWRQWSVSLETTVFTAPLFPTGAGGSCLGVARSPKRGGRTVPRQFPPQQVAVTASVLAGTMGVQADCQRNDRSVKLYTHTVLRGGDQDPSGLTHSPCPFFLCCSVGFLQ